MLGGAQVFLCLSIRPAFLSIALRTLEKAFGVLHRCIPQKKSMQDAKLPEDFMHFKLLALFPWVKNLKSIPLSMKLSLSLENLFKSSPFKDEGASNTTHQFVYVYTVYIYIYVYTKYIYI